MSESGFLQRAYALNGATQARDLYDEWASTYDKDLEKEEYVFPEHAVDALLSALPAREDLAVMRILDAGCGTGLVGVVLAKHGAKHVSGNDISPGMLEAARKKGVYEHLEEADLTKTIEKDDGSFDAVICVGTLTQGHVGPGVLDEFVRIVKGDGLIVTTITDRVWKDAGFEAKVEKLRDGGQLKVRSAEVAGITQGSSSGGRIVVLQKTLHS